jgi:hypothetical protein
MKKSRFSGVFGDYSSFSQELDVLSDPNAGMDEADADDKN